MHESLSMSWSRRPSGNSGRRHGDPHEPRARIAVHLSGNIFSDPAHAGPPVGARSAGGGHPVAMVKRVTSTLPRVWSRRGYRIVHEDDIVPADRGRLAMKLLVFGRQCDMLAYWRRHLGRRLGRCSGAVSTLPADVLHPESGRRWTEIDRRYFAVMGLQVRNLNQVVISHESVHAAFSYAERIGGSSPWRAHARSMDEELVAYPAGFIANGVALSLRKAGLL